MKLIVLIPKEDYLDINLSVLLTSENTSCLLLGNLVQTCLRNRMKSCREETQTHLMKTIKICLFSTVKAEIFELCVMLTYLWQLTPSVHLRTTVSKQSWLLWSRVRHHSVHSVYKQYSELSHSRWSCLIHPSQVTSAGKAVDCAVISTRGNMTTRPTAQTTTSTRAWPPGALSLFRLSSLASLRSKCLVQSCVAVRKSAREKHGVRAKTWPQ